MKTDKTDIDNKGKTLKQLIKIDNDIITKLHKVASFYKETSKAFDLIRKRIFVDSGSIRVRIDFETTKTFDLFLEQQEKSFKKRLKNNILHKLSILENTFSTKPVNHVIFYDINSRRNANKVIIDYHGNFKD